ncbi:hypothetical protein H5410_014399 [Solanum commersonii]|uniref:Uncharacterized protein n=1 Tax=Solanum commersonii TaxID=4109 RepID=A0A9J5ZRC2_SOLCO|nr:hypothetical protein H5410_014399 [Solanum commersonii]
MRGRFTNLGQVRHTYVQHPQWSNITDSLLPQYVGDQSEFQSNAGQVFDEFSNRSKGSILESHKVRTMTRDTIETHFLLILNNALPRVMWPMTTSLLLKIKTKMRERPHLSFL